MTHLADIELHIGNIGELLDIVGAMRSLASMRVLEAHRVLPGIRHYAETMATAIGAALSLVPEPHMMGRPDRGRRAIVLCTAEHGFVGGFNERIFEALETLFEADDALFVLGSRGAVLSHERGRPALWSYPMATRPNGVSDTIRHLTTALYQAIADGTVSRVEAVFARHRQGQPPSVDRLPLLPADLASFAAKQPRMPPLHNMPGDVLLERLVSDYIFALLMEAAVESLASENAARFAAMEAARDNVSKKLDELGQEARQARQDEITTELLDLVTGAEAQKSGKRRAPSR
jgi:F-type H+-transporting ATPase subunit gamma